MASEIGREQFLFAKELQTGMEPAGVEERRAAHRGRAGKEAEDGDARQRVIRTNMMSQPVVT